MSGERSALGKAWSGLGSFMRVVIVCFLISAAVSIFVKVPGFLDAQTRSKVSRARSDMRTLASGLEAYRIDHGAYPPTTSRLRESVDADLHPSASATQRGVRTFHQAALALTTPTAYFGSYFPPDMFGVPRGSTYAYVADADRWILVSRGPDGVFDLPMDEGIDDPARTAGLLVWIYEAGLPSRHLLAGEGPRGAYTYDPTNGLFSNGDIWRVK